MTIYIDAKLAEKNIDNADTSWCTDVDNIIEACIEALQSTPQADVAPVIHAHWIEDCGDYKCSHCSTEFWDEMVFIVRTSEHEFPNYCPVCGAKMDEEDN